MRRASDSGRSLRPRSTVPRPTPPAVARAGSSGGTPPPDAEARAVVVAVCHTARHRRLLRLNPAVIRGSPLESGQTRSVAGAGHAPGLPGHGLIHRRLHRVCRLPASTMTALLGIRLDQGPLEEVLRRLVDITRDALRGADEVSTTLVRGDKAWTAAHTGQL